MTYIIIAFLVGLSLGAVLFSLFKKTNANNINWEDIKISNYNNENIEIKSTKELIDFINNMQKELYVLSAAVIALSQTVDR